jgi:2-oxoglutarate ferredoxin oxidoreductase subunit beta
MVVLLLDNGVYGLTKNQTSPTSPKGFPSNTQPRGAVLDPLNPLTGTLGISNASFVAQTADWIPDHLYETISAGFHHKGFSFIRILQRCPQYTTSIFEQAVRDPKLTELLVHPDGIDIEGIKDLYTNHIYHDPSDLVEAHRLAANPARLLLGLYYQNESVPRLEEVRAVPSRSVEEKIDILNTELDRYAV